MSAVAHDDFGDIEEANRFGINRPGRFDNIRRSSKNAPKKYPAMAA